MREMATAPQHASLESDPNDGSRYNLASRERDTSGPGLRASTVPAAQRVEGDSGSGGPRVWEATAALASRARGISVDGGSGCPRRKTFLSKHSGMRSA
jgi:hypothetical protein